MSMHFLIFLFLTSSYSRDRSKAVDSQTQDPRIVWKRRSRKEHLQCPPGTCSGEWQHKGGNIKLQQSMQNNMEGTNVIFSEMKVLPCYEQSTTRDQCWPRNCKVTRLPAVKSHIVARKFRVYFLKMSKQCSWHMMDWNSFIFFWGGTVGRRYLWSIHSQNDGLGGWTGGLWQSVTYFSWDLFYIL